MPGKGFAPTPTATKIALGDPRKVGKRKLREQLEAEPRGNSIDPAPRRNMTLAARREWKRLLPLLDFSGVLKEHDADTLAAYCEDLAIAQSLAQRAAKLRESIEKTGDVIARKDKDGKVSPEPHPYAAMLGSLLRQMESVRSRCLNREREFGMTPSARTRIRVDGGASNTDDILAALGTPRERKGPPPLVQ